MTNNSNTTKRNIETGGGAHIGGNVNVSGGSEFVGRDKIVVHAQPRVDIWDCQKCHTPNAVGLQFCAKCGQTIGHECPKCKQMIAVVAEFCPYCGSSVKAELQANRLRQIEQIQAQIDYQQKQISDLRRKQDKLLVFSSDLDSVSAEIGCGANGLAITAGIVLGGVLMYFLERSSVGRGPDDFLAIVGGIVIMFIVRAWMARQAFSKAAKERIRTYRENIAQLEKELS